MDEIKKNNETIIESTSDNDENSNDNPKMIKLKEIKNI